MSIIEEAKQIYKIYYAKCFWSFKEDLKITMKEIPWIIEQLFKHGDTRAWQIAIELKKRYKKTTESLPHKTK